MAVLQTIAFVELLLILFIYVAPIWALIDMARRPDESWHRIQQSRVFWTILAIVLGPIGALLYAVTVRPRLRRA